MKHIQVDQDFKDCSRQLERYIQSGHLNFLIGSGASRPAIKLAGTIESQIDDQLRRNEGDEANKLALEFIEEIEYQCSFLPDNYTEGDHTDITLQEYTKLISSIDRILFERKNILLPRQANIFTTNYDMFFESAASNLPSCLIYDGFNRKVGTPEFKFAPESFFDRIYRSGTVYQHQSEVPAINLIKLHGSISWRREKELDIYYTDTPPKDTTAIEKGNPETVRSSLLKRAVILPNMRKFESTLLDRVYFDLLRLYSNALEKENALLFVFGFSFDDQHILDITRRALRNPTAMLVLFAHSQEDKQKLESKFQDHKNVLLIHPSEHSQFDFPKLNTVFDQIGYVAEPVDG